MSSGDLVLRSVLAVLAVYHIAVGSISALAPHAASRLAGGLYGFSLVENPQTGYVIRMLGLLAVALGSLLVFAALDPAANRPTIAVVAALQAARATFRVMFRRELEQWLGLAPRRNALNAAFLIGQAALLASLFPKT